MQRTLLPEFIAADLNGCTVQLALTLVMSQQGWDEG